MKQQSSSLTLILALFIFVTTSTAKAFDGAFQTAAKKTEEKKNSRWSLADWLAQKQKNQMMDMWLAKNSQSSNFEFFLEGRSINYGENAGAEDTSSSGNYNLYGGALAAYAGVAGLRGSYDQNTEKQTSWTGSVNIRLFGRAMQDTHINLEYGLRGTTFGEDASKEFFQNQYGGVSMNLYLAKYFGLEGTYHRILPVDSDRNRTMEGEDSRAGIFIDFALLRVFGYWRNEFLHFNEDSGGSSEFRQGYGGGLRLYF